MADGASPQVALDVVGDPALEHYLGERMWEVWHARPAPDAALHIRVARTGSVIRVEVWDRAWDGGRLVDAAEVTGAEPDLLYARTWLVVRSAVERAGSAPGPTTPAAERPGDAAASDDLIPAAVGVLATAAWDGGPAALGGGIVARLRAPTLMVWSLDVGVAGAQHDAAFTTIEAPVGMSSAFTWGDTWSLAIGARVSAAPRWMVGPERTAFALGAKAGPLLRVHAPLVSRLRLSLEAGLDTRLVRQSVVHDGGRSTEGLFGFDGRVGIEWVGF